MNVTNVDFHKWELHTQQCVSQRNAGMCEAPRIDNHEVALATGFVDSIDDGAFVVGLERVKRDSQLVRLLFC